MEWLQHVLLTKWLRVCSPCNRNCRHFNSLLDFSIATPSDGKLETLASCLALSSYYFCEHWHPGHPSVLLLYATVLTPTWYWPGCSQTDAVLLVLHHCPIFLDLWSISCLSSGLFPVGWCWCVVSKTREQFSSSLDSPGWKDYFTCPEGFSPVYTSSMLFAFFPTVLHCWLTFSTWPWSFPAECVLRRWRLHPGSGNWSISPTV